MPVRKRRTGHTTAGFGLVSLRLAGCTSPALTTPPARPAPTEDVKLPADPAVLVDFASNSDPDAVAGKQVRLENNAYLIYKNGKLATLSVWAPLGADNVDQWQQIAQSFRWL